MITCSLNKHHETKGVFYRRICSPFFTQDGKVSTHSASDCKKSVKKLTLGMVTRAQLQPDHVQEDSPNTAKSKAIVVNNNVGKNVNNQYPCRLLYNQCCSDLKILKQEICAYRATWKEWLKPQSHQRHK